MDYMHKDIMNTIVNDQMKRYDNGEKLSEIEMAELIVFQNALMLQNYKELAESYLESQEKIKEYGNIIIEKNKSHSNELRILNLFLSNKGLLEEYELFDMRIMRDKYDRKERI